MGRFWALVDFLISFLPIFAGVVLFVGSFFVDGNNRQSWQLPLALAIVSTALTAYVVRYEIDKVRNNKRLEEILSKVQSPLETRIVKLDKVELYYEYLRFRARTCNDSWLDMGGFDPRLKDMPSFSSRSEYYRERERVACRIEDFRYIGIFRDIEHIDRIERLIAKSNRFLSSVRYFNHDAENLGKIEVTLVDGSEVIIGYYQPDSEFQKYVALAGAPVVNLFQAHYNDLWRLADHNILKNRAQIVGDGLSRLRAALAAPAGQVSGGG